MKDNNTPKITEADKVEQKDQLAASVMADFNTARVYIKEHYEGVWADCFKSYNNIRTRRGYEGTADDFVPETFSIAESLKSAIAGTKPKFKYLPMSEEQKQETVELNALVEFYWSQNNMTRKVLNWIGDMIIYGNGIFYIKWQDDMPTVQHIPLSDFFMDPAATHMNKPEEPGYARYAGHRYLTSMEELESMKKIDLESGDLVPFYKNLSKVGSNASADEMDKDRNEQLIGSTLGKEAYDRQIEVIEYFTRYRHVVLANRDTVILDEKNPYQRDRIEKTTPIVIDGEVINQKYSVPEIQGFLPYAIARNYVDNSLFFAKGDVEVILPTQESLNDTSSQKRDNLAYVINNMWQIDPRYKHMAEQIVNEPGAVFPIGRGGLTPIEKDDVSPSADNEIQRLTQVMRTATAADAAVQGTAQRFSRTTATEVQAQLNQASMRFTTKVQNLEDEGFAQIARIFYKMVQIFVDQPLAVRTIGPKGIDWMRYNPEEYTGEYQPKVVLESTAEAMNAEVVQGLQVAAQFSLGNPLVNQQAFLRRMYTELFEDHMSEEDIEELLTVEQAPMMGPDGQPVDPSLTQGGGTMAPGAMDFMMGEGGGGAGGANSTSSRPQSGFGRGGGSDKQANNIRRTRASQPSTRLGL